MSHRLPLTDRREAELDETSTRVTGYRSNTRRRLLHYSVTAAVTDGYRIKLQISRDRPQFGMANVDNRLYKTGYGKYLW